LTKQAKIAIASVLKPLKDPRAYCRFGLSLRETNKYKINIIGFSTKNEANEKNIKFSTLFCKKRNHYSRLLSNLKLLKILFKDKPDILIVSTFELLPAGILSKFFLKNRLIYDVQENHYSNIQQNKTQSGILKFLSKSLVKIIESCSKPWVDHFFFAEACYRDELPKYIPYTVLENKFFGESCPVTSSKELLGHHFRFLISGTLTKVYGILEGIQWFKEINKHYPETTLHIIGHATLPDYKTQIESLALDHPAISIDISEFPVPYLSILKAYHHADINLMPYYQIPSIQPKIPSKLYESIALLKPCLFSPNSKWKSISDMYPAGMELDFTDLTSATVQFQNFLQQKYFGKLPGQEVLWKSQEQDFLEALERVCREG
jgi:hypothetical protein